MSASRLFDAAGSLRPAYEETDWAGTPLGPPEGWSPTLRATADLVLRTQFPATLLWGPEFVLVYNEAYVPVLAEKHPKALGMRARDAFPEAWPAVGPSMAGVLAGGGPTYVTDAAVPLLRHGRLDEAYFTFCFSPVAGPDGRPEGVLDIVTETTAQVLTTRRLGLLAELRAAVGAAEDPGALADRALTLLRTDPGDLPAVDLVARTDPRVPLALGPVATPGVVVRDAPDGPTAWAPVGGDLALAVRLSPHLAPDEAYLGFLGLVASTVGDAATRLALQERERASALAQRRMSVTMQRALLPVPVEPDHLQVAVRYQPAAEHAQVGGDWYDSFLSPDGALTLVIGDVAGHDQDAAAGMSQVRNLLRGVASALDRAPSATLSVLDRTMDLLGVGVYATALLGRVEQEDPRVGTGLRRFRFSNAGHPPPLLMEPDGTVRYLETPANMLLGTGFGDRDDHVVTLRPGATLLLYTDGLVERRGATLQHGLDWLAGAVAGLGHRSAEALCDHLLAEVEDGLDDDVAILALRPHAEDRPRPPEAGPRVMPADVRREEAAARLGAGPPLPASPSAHRAAPAAGEARQEEQRQPDDDADDAEDVVDRDRQDDPDDDEQDRQR